MNADFGPGAIFVLHAFGDKDFVELAPGEFRLAEAPLLLPHEFLNADNFQVTP